MMLRERVEKIAARVDALSLRERVLIFAAVAFLVTSLIDSLVLSPLLDKQRKLSTQVVQQQEKMKEIQAQITALLQARDQDANSPQRERIRVLRQQIADGEVYLKERRDRLVPPEKMAGLLQQVLRKNGSLQLVALSTLPVTPWIEQPADMAEASSAVQQAVAEGQIYKHGVRITVRGGYMDLLQYVSALEKLPTQMIWSEAKMSVVQYPAAELTLTLYTLSLDKTWLQI